MQNVFVNINEDKIYKNIVFITVIICGYLKSSSSTFSTSGLSLLFLINIFPETLRLRDRLVTVIIKFEVKGGRQN
jgi:hypothetical protein